MKSKKSDDLQQDTVGVYMTEREKSPTSQDVDIYTSLDPNYCSTIQNNYEPLQVILTRNHYSATSEIFHITISPSYISTPQKMFSSK